MASRVKSLDQPIGAAADRSGAVAARVIRIAPAGRWPTVDVLELWGARDLVGFLVWRDIKVRYAQTVLGAGWAVLQPLMGMVVFTVVFGRFARIPSDGVPYAAFSLTALVPWTYFSGALGGAANSLVANRNLLTKIYFPRLAIPMAPMFAGLVDFAIAFTVLLLVLAGYGIMPSPWALIVVPLSMCIAMMTALGVGSWLAALNVQYRDVKQITPFLVQIWMYASPIVYPLSLVPERYRTIYALNPMVGVVEGFRAVMLRTNSIPWAPIATSLAIAAVLFLSGAFYFRRVERVFADVV